MDTQDNKKIIQTIATSNQNLRVGFSPSSKSSNTIDNTRLLCAVRPRFFFSFNRFKRATRVWTRKKNNRNNRLSNLRVGFPATRCNTTDNTQLLRAIHPHFFTFFNRSREVPAAVLVTKPNGTATLAINSGDALCVANQRFRRLFCRSALRITARRTLIYGCTMGRTNFFFFFSEAICPHLRKSILYLSPPKKCEFLRKKKSSPTR